MFFRKKHDKIADKLAGVAVGYCKIEMEQFVDQSPDYQLSDLERARLLFCLYILNLVLIIGFVNLFECNTRQAQKIIDSLLEHFFKYFQEPGGVANPADHLRVGDYIVDPDEKNLFRQHLSMIGGITDDTKMPVHDLLSIAYNIRVRVYSSALAMMIKENFTSSANLEFVDLFVCHFTGKPIREFHDHPTLYLFLMNACNNISKVVEKVISGKL